jgi:steroid 5-alpha reductase family enzyme
VFDWQSYWMALGVLFGMGLVTWVISVVKRDVGIVDTLWSLMFLAAALVFWQSDAAGGERATLVLGLVTLWALRLAGHIGWRNWGEGEDRRYQEIRARNEPGFAYKSLYLVFWLQAVIALIVALPLLAALQGDAPIGLLDYVGVGLFVLGFFFEAVGDWQLAAFKRDPDNKGKVLDTGLWRYTRHPNYFGNACIWWGFFAFGLAAGGWWAIVSPVLMTFLLLRVSGVALLEKDIAERRPAYRDYVQRTNAFLPGRPRQSAGAGSMNEVKS